MASEEEKKTCKKIINATEDLVEEMVDGLVACHPTLNRLDGFTVIVRNDFAEIKESRVAIISGGGSGHEPAHGRSPAQQLSHHLHGRGPALELALPIGNGRQGRYNHEWALDLLAVEVCKEGDCLHRLAEPHLVC